MPFVFVVGGRDTGKTYSSLIDVAVNDPCTFALMRRTDSELQTICNPATNVFKRINQDTGRNIYPFRASKSTFAFYETVENEKGGHDPEGCILGYGMALSTLHTIRGFDASDIDILIYDEFIPERHQKRITGEFDALVNAYDTINRLRELEGRKALQMICLANANDLANPIFQGFGIVSEFQRLIRTHKEYKAIPHKGFLLINLSDSPISKKRKESALYAATKGTSFAAMSFDNTYAYHDMCNIHKMPLNEFKPLVSIGQITIMAHKNRDELYTIGKQIAAKRMYGRSEPERIRFKRECQNLWYYYLDNRIKFDSVLTQRLFNDLFRGG